MTGTYANGPVLRPHYAATISGNTDHDVWKRLMNEWYGLQPLQGDAWILSARCAHKLIGKRCPGRVSCPEVDDIGDQLWDHARAWKDTRGDRVFTLEPWGNPFAMQDGYARLRTHADALDIAHAFEGRSPYGSSFVMFLAPKSSAFGKQMTRHAPVTP